MGTTRNFIKFQLAAVKFVFPKHPENKLGKIINIINLVCYSFWVTFYTISAEAPLAHRYVTYDDHRPGEKLLPEGGKGGKYLSVFVDVKSVKCAQLCTVDPQCKSFNFYGVYCELNTEDAYSLNATFVTDSRSVYIGMMRNEAQTFDRTHQFRSTIF